MYCFALPLHQHKTALSLTMSGVSTLVMTHWHPKQFMMTANGVALPYPMTGV
nr:hypothetical protein [uncultured Bacteroides sp.]